MIDKSLNVKNGDGIVTNIKEIYEHSILDIEEIEYLANKVAKITTIGKPTVSTKKNVQVEYYDYYLFGILKKKKYRNQLKQVVTTSNYWILASYHNSFCIKTNNCEETEREISHWILRDDGLLMFGIEKVFQVVNKGYPMDKTVYPASFRPMSESEILQLDYIWKKYDNSLNNRKNQKWGNFQTEDLAVTRKGEGLINRLKKMI